MLEWLVSKQNKPLLLRDLDTKFGLGKDSYCLTHFTGYLANGDISRSHVQIFGTKVKLRLRIPHDDLRKDASTIIKSKYESLPSLESKHKRSFRLGEGVITSNFIGGLSFIHYLDKSYDELTQVFFSLNEGPEIADKLYTIVKDIAPDYYASRINS